MRRAVAIGLAITSFTLVTIFYIGTSSSASYLDLPRLLHSSNATGTPPPPPPPTTTNGTRRRSARVLCLILSTPKNFLTRAKAVHETWARRCDQYFFVTEDVTDTLTAEQRILTRRMPVARISNITPGYDHLTQKSTLAFLYAFEHHGRDFDWFIKADDDTFVIVEHLKHFLGAQNASEPVTFGYNFKVIVSNGYHSGGASYVLSREALRRFHHAHTDPTLGCRKDGGAEDVEVAKCLRSVGVYPGKSLDEQGRELFHPLPFVDHFRGSFPDWLQQYAENPLQTGYNCCSVRSISFHYVSPEDQYYMEFLLYKARPASAADDASADVPWNSTTPVKR